MNERKTEGRDIVSQGTPRSEGEIGGSDRGSAGTLFVVATPIGNLGDMSHRALDALRNCSRVAAEDTRRTRALLNHFGIVGKPLDAIHAHSAPRDIQRLVAHLRAGETIALATDAGTPLVSDPGGEAVRAAIEAGLAVVPIPGASAVLTALVGSGLAGDGGFRFMGFLPRDGTSRHVTIAKVCNTEETVVLFEAPNRVQGTLADLAAATPHRGVCVARELTKLHEEFVRGTCGELAASPREWLGEVVLVLGPHVPDARESAVSDEDIVVRIRRDLEAGMHAKTIAERVAAWSGRPRRDIYERVLELKRSLPGA